MRRWIGLAARLYPAEWRRRYGAEFDALLDDAGLQWRDLADVVRGALIVRLTTLNSYWKTGALAAVAGAIIAGGASFAFREQYVAAATLQVANRTPSEKPAAQLLQALQQLQLEVLGRDNLKRLIQDPRFDLYGEERKRIPVEAIAHEMARKHVRIAFFAAPNGSGQAGFRIIFEYPDRFKAYQVVTELVSMFEARNTSHSAGSPTGLVMSVWEEPLLPLRPSYPARGSIAIVGAIAGMMMGLLSVTVWRRTRYAVVTMSVPRETKRFVDSQVGPGGYPSASDYIRELLRADEQRQSSLRS
jgi:hypothetical protein